MAYLKASRSDRGEPFGTAVDLSADRVVVGAPGGDSGATGVDGDDADLSAAGAGAAHVSASTDPGWAHEAYLKATNTGEYDRFGVSVAMAGDALVVGAQGEASSSTGSNGDQSDDRAEYSGAAYVFERPPGVNYCVGALNSCGAPESTPPASVGGPVRRLHPPLPADAVGRVEKAIDFTSDPVLSDIALTVPAQWNFQFWYRDAGSVNLTDAIALDFVP